MTDRLLYPFEPEMPRDVSMVTQFNALTYSAWGMREKRVQVSSEREW